MRESGSPRPRGGSPNPAALEGREEVKEMPLYEFQCEKCSQSFSLWLSLAEYDKGAYECPRCKSKKVRRLVSSFQTKTSKKS